ncbi:MAG: peptide-methionine (R)-S-oxide reductase MsrB [Dokdonella sp.]|uniref:peptide-methionine (R)-S-oxide reductase MsrB n=1 Tax=Dokdonella sp. TaxID=2291710 RepID=UPI003F81D63D
MTSSSRPVPDAMRRSLLLGGSAAVTGLVAFGLRRSLAPFARAASAESFEVTLSDEAWKARLTPDQYAVLRHEATEPPYSSPLEREHRAGTFHCAGCGNALFASSTKFESGTGWPSFYAPLPHAVGESRDTTLGMLRTEVHCARCGGHLGHVFDDGPKPTGLRYCMNGVALTFEAAA